MLWVSGIKSVDKIDEILLAIDRHVLLRTGEQEHVPSAKRITTMDG